MSASYKQSDQDREVDEGTAHESPSSVFDLIEELSSQVPDEEWEKLPRDLSINLDYYLYGAPKRER